MSVGSGRDPGGTFKWGNREEFSEGATYKGVGRVKGNQGGMVKYLGSSSICNQARSEGERGRSG